MKQQLEEQGYLILDGVLSPLERKAVADVIEVSIDVPGTAFRRQGDLFAIRRVLAVLPQLSALLFTPGMMKAIAPYMDKGCFISKSIYFDKPVASNWFVPYHQDLTISVDNKTEVLGFGPWSRKDGYFAVQPPVSLLEQQLTLRIHLDDTDESNGALNVIPGSHRKGIYRPETIDWSIEKEKVCKVPAGGLMLMRPLLLHASSRSKEGKRRRVLHIELNHAVLPAGMAWAEKQSLP
ncbi:phytanoyl-CoA dioxygenase family protein [Taibaiella koreensis]|uniref:phytanoyl-CoA dioxygenase family protein n=1 Tax=Taibaiella koreensis TaxID=1268548 RepID=UPI000E5A0C9D|nr:phytanoyl-CoA dioxygenase family protein [Taibaiella koreensis]